MKTQCSDNSAVTDSLPDSLLNLHNSLSLRDRIYVPHTEEGKYYLRILSQNKFNVLFYIHV